MSLKRTLTAVAVSFPGMVTRVLAAGSNYTDLSYENGRNAVMGIRYAGTMQTILDSMYFLLNRLATFALLILIAKIILGGWGTVEAEIRGRRAFTMLIVALAGLKVGLLAIDMLAT